MKTSACTAACAPSAAPPAPGDMQKFLLDMTHAGDGCRTRHDKKKAA